MVPEMSLPRVFVGSLCLDQATGKRTTVLGFSRDGQIKEALHLNQPQIELNHVIGVEYDSDSPRLHTSSFWSLKPELEPSPESVAKASLVFNDRTILGQMLEAITNCEQSSKSLLLTNFLLNGLLIMLSL